MTCLAIVYTSVEAWDMEWSAYSIPGFIMLILDNKDHVESRQDGRLEIDILSG